MNKIRLITNVIRCNKILKTLFFGLFSAYYSSTVLVALEGLSGMVRTCDAEMLRPLASKILSLSESSFRALTSGFRDYYH
jgi:hypothetical protein